MKELNIFIDESGDFGEYATHSPFYIITMVFHEQNEDILPAIIFNRHYFFNFLNITTNIEFHKRAHYIFPFIFLTYRFGIPYFIKVIIIFFYNCIKSNTIKRYIYFC